MSEIYPVACEVQGQIATLFVDHPPVNTINAAVRAGLIAGLQRAQSDPSVEAIVVTARGNTFIAGADLVELSDGIAEPSYRDTLRQIEDCPKPVVAVLHGNTLGAGVEVALACHYRVALADAKIGLPEISLGIVPGAGATQRLPRLIGPSAALRMLIGGSPMSAGDALAAGLVDAVASGDPAAAGSEFALDLLSRGVGSRPTRNLMGGSEEFGGEQINAILKANAKSLNGRKTQHAMVEAVNAAVSLPFEDGLALEKALSDASLLTRESLALRHMFFAERATNRIPGVSRDAGALPVRKVAVIGAGTMGSGIAMAFGNAGFDVVLVDANEQGLERGRQIIRENYEGSAKRGRMTPDQAEAAIAKIALTLEMKDISEVDLAIEAVFENMDLKKSVLAQIDRAVAPHAIIASNTSSLSVTELGNATSRPDKVLGLHFFSPAHIMKLLEIVRGDQTSPETLLTGLEVAKRIRKIPAISGDGFGFIGNRMMLDGAFREGEQMMLEGAGVDQIDHAIERFGFAMGPSRVNDMAGVDIGTLVREQLFLRASRRDPYCIVSDTLTSMGRVGQKVGKGFYSYSADPRVGALDPEVTKVIERLAFDRWIARRAFADDEIVERFVLQLINVGAEILAEGIAYRAADIDVVWVHGFGFPRHLGGPMFHADTLGIKNVLERVRHWHRILGDYWKPSPLLEKLAATNSSFAAYDRALGRQ
jgi:3-hydroxyacyl-CoA dehydrogenase